MAAHVQRRAQVILKLLRNPQKGTLNDFNSENRRQDPSPDVYLMQLTTVIWLISRTNSGSQRGIYKKKEVFSGYITAAQLLHSSAGLCETLLAQRELAREALEDSG